MDTTHRQRDPVKLEIVDVEKVKGISNYYVYIIKVACSDDSTYYIYRRYRQFDELNSALEKRFPIEAGSINYKDRTLPHLPSKKVIGRSAIREVTEKRLPVLNDYLRSLYQLPNKIRYDTIVSHFSALSPEDRSRPAYSSQVRPSGIVIPASKPSRPAPPTSRGNSRPPSRPQAAPTLKSSARPLTTPRNNQMPPRLPLPARPSKLHPHPQPARPPQPHPTANTGKGKAVYSYSAAHSDELSFSEGDMLLLHELADGGVWWKASLRGEKGLAPGNYIQVLSRPVVRDIRDSVADSDEWDSSDGEGVEGEARTDSAFLTYYYNNAARTMEVDGTLVTTPTYVQLYRALQKQLHGVKMVLNYKDTDGDLVQLCGQQDMQLLTTDATPPATPTGRRQVGRNPVPWAIYVTKQGDNSVYNVDPYKSR